MTIETAILFFTAILIFCGYPGAWCLCRARAILGLWMMGPGLFLPLANKCYQNDLRSCYV